jgi:hypothetical protein
MLKGLTKLLESTIKYVRPPMVWWMRIFGHLLIAMVAALVVEALKEQGILKKMLPFIF